MDNRKKRGKKGEAVACNYLEEKEYLILEKNYQTRYGEIDIIAKTSLGVVVLIEVKAYTNKDISPLEVITPKKKKKLIIMAKWYMAKNNLQNTQFRFDLITVKYDQIIDHLENIEVFY